jgi:hypothetical protein
MAGRIRSIKPELRELAAFAALTDRAVRLYFGILSLVDDTGRCPAGASFLAGAIWFARPCAANLVGKALAELATAKIVSPYEVNGAPFLEIVGWTVQGGPTHQRIEKPQPGRYPRPRSNHSGNGSGNDSGTDLRSQITDLRPPTPLGVAVARTQREISGAEALSLPASSAPPTGFQPAASSPGAKALAELLGNGRLTREQADEELAKFPAHAEAEGWPRSTWDSRSATWLRNAAAYYAKQRVNGDGTNNGKQGRSAKRGPHRTSPDDDYSETL